jgi:hypothetical protein
VAFTSALRNATRTRLKLAVLAPGGQGLPAIRTR